MDEAVQSARGGWVGAGQFALFRVLFGVYWFQHFARLATAGSGISSVAGLPGWTRGIAAVLALAGGAFALGFHRRAAAVGLGIGGMVFSFGRCALAGSFWPIAIGAVALLCAWVPEGEPGRCAAGRGRTPRDWLFPAGVYKLGWLLLAMGYAVAGVGRLRSSDWLEGTALRHLLDSPLARVGLFSDGLRALPDGLLALLTWSVLAAELVFLPLSMTRRGRPIVWLGLLGLQLGGALVFKCAALGAGVALLHLFVFDARWLPVRRDRRAPVLLYDGACGLCQAVVRSILREDPTGRLRFAPLQGASAQAYLRAQGLPTRDFDSLVFVPDWNRPARGAYRLRTDGIAAALDELGGVWRVASWGRIVPRRLRDPLYALVARTRYALFGAYRPSPLPRPEWARRFLS